MMNTRSIQSLVIALIFGLISLTGCEDGNLFGRLHNRGESGSISSLQSDAKAALRDRNYSQALALYEQILAQDSDNSEALLGAAAAGLGSSGLSLAQVIANILNQTTGAGSSSMGLRELVASSGGSGVHTLALDPDSLLSGIDLTALDAVIDPVVCRLEKITSGSSDGVISRDDIDTLVNLAVVLVLRAALDAQQAGLIDITNVNGTWSFANGANYGTFCGNSANDPTLISIATDLSGAYACLTRVVTLLNLTGNQVVVQVRSDVNDIITNLLTSGLPAGCRTTLDTNGINASTFPTFFDLGTPPSGC